MTTIYLVRHGQTEWNATKRAQGQADIDLDPRGRAQAVKVAFELSRHRVRAVYSSDLKRAVDTARPIADSRGVDLILEPAFREIDQGDWEGLSVDEIRERWPDLWGPARHYSARPNGEAPHTVRARALEGIRRIVEAHPHGSVVVVSHGGTIRWIAAEALGYDDHRSARIRGLGNGQMVSVDARLVDGRLELDNLVRLDGATPDLDDPND
jgi:broad specificity phosphatase PhoE